MDEIIRRVREQLNARINARNDLTTELNELRAVEEFDEARETELRDKRAAVDAEIEPLKERLDTLEREKQEDEVFQRMQTEVTPTPAAPGDTEERAHVNEARTYAPETDVSGESFVRDVVSAHLGNWDAQERLQRHMKEEMVERGDKIQRATTTGAPALVVPQYLVDLYAAKGRPGRKLADQMRKHRLPAKGMKVEIPRQIAKTSAGVQATELTAVSETNYTDELKTVDVITAAGAQTVSRQSLERSEGTFDIILEDLLKAYHSDLDNVLVNHTTWGLSALANVVTYTAASPTAPELYGKIIGAQTAIEDVLLDLDEDEVFTLMRSRRWGWLRNQHTDEHPFIQAVSVPTGTSGTNADVGYKAGVRGFLPDGGAVVVDNHIATNKGTGENEDEVFVIARQEAHLWEDPAAPYFIRAEQSAVKRLGIDVVVYGYFAACFDRVVDEQGTPKAVHQKITGTGLVAPTF